MKKRALTSVFIVLVTALAILSKLIPHEVGNYIFDGFVMVIAMIAGFEMCNILGNAGRPTNRYLSSMYCIFNYIILLSCLRVVNLYFIPLIQLALTFVYFLLILLVESIRNKADKTKNNLQIAANSVITCIYPGFLICLMLAINHADVYAGIKNFSLAYIILIFAITMLTDTFAYLVGSLIKGPKLAPKISPNKTISGAIGGLIGGIAGAMLVFALVYNVSSWSTMLSMYSLKWWHFLIMGLIGSVVAQCGDLLESKIKRKANVKDSGSIFPGHGGMLDRVDAMIMVSTFIFLSILIILI